MPIARARKLLFNGDPPLLPHIRDTYEHMNLNPAMYSEAPATAWFTDADFNPGKLPAAAASANPNITATAGATPPVVWERHKAKDANAVAGLGLRCAL